jgi:hypothetical protein
MHPEWPLWNRVRKAGFSPELEANLHCLMMAPGAGALVTSGGISQAATYLQATESPSLYSFPARRRHFGHKNQGRQTAPDRLRKGVHVHCSRTFCQGASQDSRNRTAYLSAWRPESHGYLNSMARKETVCSRRRAPVWSSSLTSMLNLANSSIKFLQRLLICHTSVAFNANRKMYDIGTPLFFTMSYI